MTILRKRRHKVPELNTSSLPDLIFTVLFFFMIVTHMRKTELKVKFQVPQGTELTRLEKKSAISYIYIGHAQGSRQDNEHFIVQMNDKVVSSPDELEEYVRNERSAMAPEDLQRMTVSIKADKATPMGMITDVKLALRRSKALRVSYSATEANQESRGKLDK